MFLRYLSDLHLEFLSPYELEQFIKKFPLPHPTEICILAGDIGKPGEPHYDLFMQFISSRFTKTFVIAGNHEYYHPTRTIDETNQWLEQYFQGFENISFLNNTVEIYEGKCFIGSVLWSHIKEPQYTINDTKMIPHLTVDTYNQMNQICVAFLETAIHSHKNCIVITHHMPSASLIDVKYRDPILLPYNQWFYCDMESLFLPQVKAWFYGHTHMPSRSFIQDIPFLCNPIGYPDENPEPNLLAIRIIE